MVLWYASRAAGLVALVLLTATTVLGISGAVRFAAPGWPRFVLSLLHRNLALLTVAFLALHLTTAVVDGYVGIRWIDTVVPFISAYEPFWLGLGVVAFEIVIALVISSLVRHRIGLRTWRAVHWAGYLCWPVAVIHGLGIGGKDSQTPWVLALTVACIALLVAGLAWRAYATTGARVPGERSHQ